MKKNQKINLIINIIMSILTLVVGILFILQIWNIYFTGKDSGSQIYSREIIATYFGKILIPVIIYIVALIASIVLHYIFPKEKEVIKVEKDYKILFESLASRKEIDENTLSYLNKQKKLRLIYLIINIVISLASLTMCLLYVCNKKNFDITGSLIEEAISLAAHVLPFLFIMGVSNYVYMILKKNSYKNSFEIIKSCKNKNSNVNKKEYEMEKKIILVTRCVVFVVGVFFVIFGALNGGINDVLFKAINICTECIGLG